MQGRSGWQVHWTEQPSGPWQNSPSAQSLELVQGTGWGATRSSRPQGPRRENLRAGQVELAWNVLPSQPQNGTRSRVQRAASSQVQTASQPSPPWHTVRSGQSEVVSHAAGLEVWIPFAPAARCSVWAAGVSDEVLVGAVVCGVSEQAGSRSVSSAASEVRMGDRLRHGAACKKEGSHLEETEPTRANKKGPAVAVDGEAEGLHG